MGRGWTGGDIRADYARVRLALQWPSSCPEAWPCACRGTWRQTFHIMVQAFLCCTSFSASKPCNSEGIKKWNFRQTLQRKIFIWPQEKCVTGTEHDINDWYDWYAAEPDPGTPPSSDWWTKVIATYWCISDMIFLLYRHQPWNPHFQKKIPIEKYEFL